eukprot:gene7563-8401_t
MDCFEERSGLVTCTTPWGKWGQTIEDVIIYVDVPEGTVSKMIQCVIQFKKISLIVKDTVVFQGELYGNVIADDCIWTLEDRKLVHINLVKAKKDAANCWRSLLIDDFVVDPLTFSEMEKKLTLERFQRENPGFDFSKADMTGNYHGGGPTLPGS